MGNSQNNSRDRYPNWFLQKYATAKTGEVIHVCSLEKWNVGRSASCGFEDLADFVSPRDGHHCIAYLLGPDTVEGRCIRVSRNSNLSINLEESIMGTNWDIDIPECFSSGVIPWQTRQDFGRLTMQFIMNEPTRDGIEVIGCRGDLVVIQILNKKNSYVPEFYFIDIKRGVCLDKFATKEAELLWYECYISPDKSRVILRAEMYVWSPYDSFKYFSLQANNMDIILIKKFPDSGGHAITFDNRHSNRYLIRAKEKVVQLFDLDTLKVLQSQANPSLPAPIRQIRSSPSGSYLAARCVHPAYSTDHQTNVIAIMPAETMEVAFQIDVKSVYWPSSKVINLHVFPKFSACESIIATMKATKSKRKVFTWKLPNLCFSLQHNCRRVIRRCVSAKDLLHLPLPKRMFHFLQYQA